METEDAKEMAEVEVQPQPGSEPEEKLDDQTELYRTMANDGGMPLVKQPANSVSLPARVSDIKVYQPGDIVKPPKRNDGIRQKGMSAALKISALPAGTLPPKWGGADPRNARNEIWQITVAELGPDLTALNDHGDHVSIGPSKEMSIAEYQQALLATRSKWKIVALPARP
jgi:hypothetical protein